MPFRHLALFTQDRPPQGGRQAETRCLGAKAGASRPVGFPTKSLAYPDQEISTIQFC